MTPELENKILNKQIEKLIADIRVMACGECFDAIQMRIKWRQIFKNEEDLNRIISEAIKERKN